MTRVKEIVANLPIDTRPKFGDAAQLQAIIVDAQAKELRSLRTKLGADIYADYQPSIEDMTVADMRAELAALREISADE